MLRCNNQACNRLLHASIFPEGRLGVMYSASVLARLSTTFSTTFRTLMSSAMGLKLPGSDCTSYLCIGYSRIRCHCFGLVPSLSHARHSATIQSVLISGVILSASAKAPFALAAFHSGSRRSAKSSLTTNLFPITVGLVLSVETSLPQIP